MAVITNQRSRVLGGSGLPWWLRGGVSAANAIGVYQPKGAASLAASYVNLANPGTYNAAPVAAPTFATATGWTFAAASSQSLTTGIVPINNQQWTIMIRFSGAGSGAKAAIGCSGGAANLKIHPNNSGVRYYSGSLTLVGAGIVSGVLAIAGAEGYRNGVAEGGTIAAATGTFSTALSIGATNGTSEFFDGNVQAVAIYNTTLSAAQVLAVSTAMAAL